MKPLNCYWNYTKLVARVCKLDAKAAWYMLWGARRIKHWYPAKDLDGAFVWGDSKQGHKYWSEIWQKLEG